MGVWIENGDTRAALIMMPVTPCMGVWIENEQLPDIHHSWNGHSLYGSVD